MAALVDYVFSSNSSISSSSEEEEEPQQVSPSAKKPRIPEIQQDQPELLQTASPHVTSNGDDHFADMDEQEPQPEPQLPQPPNSTSPSAPSTENSRSYAMKPGELTTEMGGFLKTVRDFFTRATNLERQAAAVKQTTYLKTQERLLCK